jgi:transposase
MRILAIDIGKSNSVACDYDTVGTTHEFQTIRTTPQEVRDLLIGRKPDRVVVEVCSTVGWIVDLCRAMSIEGQVANTTHDAWRWKNVRKKTDRDDALKLAQLSAANQLPTVHIPDSPVRQWRSLIAYRHRLVAERTRVKNAIRALFDQHALELKPDKKAWSIKAVSDIQSQSRDAEELELCELWRGQLKFQCIHLEQLDGLIRQVTAKLDAIGEKDTRVQLLRSIPGVGARLAEIIVATIDDPKRFTNGKQVGSYAGLTPRQFQSGSMDRKGRISCQGNPLLRALLVEIAWASRVHNPWLKSLCQRYERGSKNRTKIAIVAVARHLLVVCCAMLRDGTRWKGAQTTAMPA